MKAALILRILWASAGEIELNLRGNHRVETMLVKAGQDVLQYHAWLE